MDLAVGVSKPAGLNVGGKVNRKDALTFLG